MHTSKLWWKLVAAQLILCSACVGCKKTEEEKPAAEQPAAPPPVAPLAEPAATTQTGPVPGTPVAAPPPVAVPGPAVVAAGITGTLTVTPNPVPICDKTGNGVATVHWTAEKTKTIEVRVGAPDGTLFLAAHGKKGEMKTGPWVTKDYKFFLQAVDDHAPHNADYTIATVTPDVVGGGPCP